MTVHLLNRTGPPRMRLLVLVCAPAMRAVGPTYVQLAAGMYHTCALMSDGSVDCWGGNAYGQATDQVGPYVQISAGDVHTCGLRANGTVSCWGMNDDRTNGSAGPFTQITSSYAHNCGVMTDGNIDYWGLDTTVGHIVVVVSNVGR